MTWLILTQVCFALAWLMWLLSVPFRGISQILLWAERRLTMAGVKAKIRAPGVARP